MRVSVEGPDVAGAGGVPDVAHGALGVGRHALLVLAGRERDVRLGEAARVKLVRERDPVAVVREAVAEDVDAGDVAVAAHVLAQRFAPEPAPPCNLPGVRDGHHADGLQEVAAREVGVGGAMGVLGDEAAGDALERPRRLVEAAPDLQTRVRHEVPADVRATEPVH